MTLFGVILFVGGLVSVSLYALAIWSGACILMANRPLAIFRWRDVRILATTWLAYMTRKSLVFTIPADLNTSGPKWLAIFFSTSSAVVFGLLQIRNLGMTGLEAEGIIRAYYLLGHFAAAFGALGFHVWAAVQIQPAAGEHIERPS